MKAQLEGRLKTEEGRNNLGEVSQLLGLEEKDFMAELPASLLADKDKPTWVKYQEELLSVILSPPLSGFWRKEAS